MKSLVAEILSLKKSSLPAEEYMEIVRIYKYKITYLQIVFRKRRSTDGQTEGN